MDVIEQLNAHGFTEAARSLAAKSFPKNAERAWVIFNKSGVFLDIDGQPWRAPLQLKNRPKAP